MTALDLARRLCERAATVGLAASYPWEALTDATRRQWLTLAEAVGPNPVEGGEAATRLLAVEQLLQVTIRRLDELATTQRSLLLIGESMSAQLERLEREVAEARQVMGDAIAFINGLSAEIRASRAEPAKLDALADSLDERANALAATMAPAAPNPTPPAPQP